MEKKIIEASELPNNEKIYLRKSFDGWRVVYPLRNEDGSINWFNTLTGGNWWKLIVLTIIVLVVLGLAQEYISNLKFCADLMNYMNNRSIVLDNNPIHLLNMT